MWSEYHDFYKNSPHCVITAKPKTFFLSYSEKKNILPILRPNWFWYKFERVITILSVKNGDQVIKNQNYFENCLKLFTGLEYVLSRAINELEKSILEGWRLFTLNSKRGAKLRWTDYFSIFRFHEIEFCAWTFLLTGEVLRSPKDRSLT